jgi:hypothetical protein
MQLKLQTIQLMKFTKRIRVWKGNTPSTIQQIPHHSVETKGSILCSQNHDTSRVLTFMYAVHSITSIPPKVN